MDSVHVLIYTYHERQNLDGGIKKKKKTLLMKSVKIRPNVCFPADHALSPTSPPTHKHDCFFVLFFVLFLASDASAYMFADCFLR